MAAHIESTRLPFIVITAIAAVLLQGVLIADYAFGAMLKAIWFEEFANGKTLHRIYTGLPVVDELLAMSVSFWDPVATTMPALRIEATMLCASLQTFAVWAAIEHLRKGDKHLIFRWAPVYVFCWQYFGTAIFVPFYCFTELNRHFNPKLATDPSISYLQAKALLPAALLAAILPFRMVYFPPTGTTDSQYQTFIAWYQLGPFACSALVATFAHYMSSDSKTVKHVPINADAWWIKLTYAVFGSFSGIVHLLTMLRLAISKDSAISFSNVFVPKWSRLYLPGADQSLYAEECLFFLQWDFILVVLACSIWITRITEGMFCAQDGGWEGYKSPVLVLGFGIACIMLGPGAVVSGVLFLREDFLRRTWAAKQGAESRPEKGLRIGEEL